MWWFYSIAKWKLIDTYKDWNYKYSESHRELSVDASMICDYTIKTFYVWYFDLLAPLW